MDTDTRAPELLPVVCIGMSAGGIAPIKVLLKRLSPQTGMTFVVIPHLLGGERSRFPELLGRWTSMPVEFASMEAPLRPNHVYVIPPNREMTVSNGQFLVQPKSKPQGWSNVITVFLLSLAKSRSHPGIAVILSGLDSDGAAALQAIRENGGTTIAQDTRSSQHSDMPQAAIDTGFVDYVLPAHDIAGKLEQLAQEFQHPNRVTPS